MRIFDVDETDLFKAINHPQIPRIGDVRFDEMVISKTAEPAPCPLNGTRVTVRYEKKYDVQRRFTP